MAVALQPDSSAVASAVGATIVDKDKATLGTITDVIMASPTQAAGYVVDLAGNKNLDVFLGANAVTFGKSGTAAVNLTSDQFLNLKPIAKEAHKKMEVAADKMNNGYCAGTAK